MNHGRLHGTVALVTGGGKGIGRETARQLGQLGARLFICGRDQKALAATTDAFRAEGLAADYVACDVRNAADCARLVDTVRERAGRLDILVNNAGMSMRGSLEDTAPEVMAAMAEINFLGAAYVTARALPLLKTAKGSVVFISSLTALRGLPQVGPYGASKKALIGLAESLRAEVGGQGVHVGVVHVGFTENDPDKVVYGQDGSLVPLDSRRNAHTQAQAASHIVKNVLSRKRESTLTGLGKLAAFFYRYFPGLADWLIVRFVSGSRQFAAKPR